MYFLKHLSVYNRSKTFFNKCIYLIDLVYMSISVSMIAGVGLADETNVHVEIFFLHLNISKRF